MSSKVGVITGAGSGIGRACAFALAGAGYQLVLAGRRQQPLNELADGLPTSTLAVPTDVSDAAAVRNLFSQIEQRFGRLDLLFNNAGINTATGEFSDVPESDWRAVVDVNLTGSFLCAQAAFRLMSKQSPRGGRIINNGSIAAHSPRPNSAAYTATKHAITGLTKSISLDGRTNDIACGQIDIGNAATDMAGKMRYGVPQADGSTAVEPVMQVDNVARAVVFMAELPLEANVQFMTVMATQMPYVGRG